MMTEVCRLAQKVSRSEFSEFTSDKEIKRKVGRNSSDVMKNPAATDKVFLEGFAHP